MSPIFRSSLIIFAAIVLAYAAWSNAAAALYSKFSPPTGLRLDPSSALALINITEAAAKAKPSQFEKVAAGNARRALKSEPLSARAIRQLGVYYGLQGDQERARELVQLSSRMSKRDPAGQLWLAEDALRRRDGLAAMRAFDALIRTTPETHELAFQTLGAALGVPEFRSIFVDYTRRQPAWLKPFIQTNIGTMERPELLSKTLIMMQPLPKDVLDEATSAALLTSLANRAPIAEVRDFYRTLPGTNNLLLRSLSFAKPSDAFRLPPIGWETYTTGNVQGFGIVEGRDAAIEAIVMPGRSGTVARKLLYLTAGRYRWRGVADVSKMVAGGTVSVRMTCNTGPGSWTSIGASELKNGQNATIFTVPANCPAQLLQFDVVGGDSQIDSSMLVHRMALEPIE